MPLFPSNGGASQEELDSKLNKSGDTISSVDGTGFLGYPAQSANPSTPSSGFRFFADSLNRLSWRGQNGFIRTFDGTANTADQSYTLPNESGTIALTNDGQVINGVAHFVRSTAPTARINGSALRDNDLWYDSSTGRQWTRRGIYWVSPQLFVLAPVGTGFLVSATTTTPQVNIPRLVFVSSVDYYLRVIDINNDSTDFWTIDFDIADVSNATVVPRVASVNTQGLTTGERYQNIVINAVFSGGPTLNSLSAMQLFRWRATKTGSATNRLHLVAKLNYQEIYA